MPKTSATGSGGFTLLELLVVLAISALAAAAVPLVFSSSGMAMRQSKAGAQRLAAAVYEAQSLSVLYDQPAQLRVDGQALNIRFGAVEGLRARSELVIPIGAHISIRGDPSDSQSSDTAVYPDGSSSGGQFQVGAGQNQILVSLSPMTGRVTMGVPLQ